MLLLFSEMVLSARSPLFDITFSFFYRHPSVSEDNGSVPQHAWARNKEILVCPIVRIPLSASLMISKGMQAIHLALALLQELLLRCKR